MRCLSIIVFLIICGLLNNPTSLGQESSVGEPEGEQPILIRPRRADEAQNSLDAYLSGPEYEPDTHALLALNVASALVVDDKTNKAVRALKDQLDLIDGASLEARAARATILDALANLELRRGNLNERLAFARFAYSTLSDDDPAKRWAKLKLGQAYIDADFQNPSANFMVAGARHLAQLSDDPDARAIERAHAEILLIVARGNRYQRKLEWFERSIEAILDRPDQTPAVKFLGLKKLATLFVQRDQPQKAEQVLVRFNREVAEFLPDDIGEVEVIPLNRRSASYDGTRQLFEQTRAFSQIGLGDPINRFESLIAGNFLDVSYCVTRGGKVADLEILASKGSKSWVDRIAAMAATRYFQADMEAPECRFRYERMRVETTSTTISGSRLKRNSPRQYLVVTNLLAGDAMFDRSLLRAHQVTAE